MTKSDGQDIESAIQEILAQNARKKDQGKAAAQAPDAPDSDAANDPRQAAADANVANGALEDEIEALKSERDELKNKFMRALADAENSRKRSERDRREAEQYGGSRLSRDLLPVYDNLQRALAAISDDARQENAALIEGLELTLRELKSVFTKHGIAVIEPEAGDKFDPQIHEAMFEAPLPGTRAGEIIQVMTVGFMLHDRLLRPAQVGVSSTPAS